MVQREKQKESRELQQAKMELAAAHEAGEVMVLRQMALRYPAQLETLTDFVAGLHATDVAEQEETLSITEDIEALTQRARQRALNAVFSTATVARPTAVAVKTLTEVRTAKGISLVALAQRLGLAADVVQKLERGRILAASVPQRLTDQLAEVLAVSKEQVQALLSSTPGAEYALRRQRLVGKNSRVEGQAAQSQTFAEAVQNSPSMAAEQRAFWLAESTEI